MKQALLKQLLPFSVLLFALAGCQSVRLSNLTPAQIAENPSGIYTFTVRAETTTPTVEDESMRATITINGETYPMTRVPGEALLFEFDYRMPAGQDAVKYYYTVNYEYETGGVLRSDSLTSRDVYYSELINRYIIALEADRGPVGAEIPVSGRNFSPGDTIEIGGVEADTTFNAPNSLTFTVPPLEAGQSYEVRLLSGRGNLAFGGFVVDGSSIRVFPTEITVGTGERTQMLLSIDREAPAGGLWVDVTTNIPQSIVMPEVVIPEGARSVNVPLEGARPGEGRLRISAPGFDSATVPVTVQ